MVDIAHIGNNDLRETWKTAKDNDMYKKIRINLIPNQHGAIVDL
jgi:hypothetical protein